MTSKKRLGKEKLTFQRSRTVVVDQWFRQNQCLDKGFRKPPKIFAWKAKANFRKCEAFLTILTYCKFSNNVSKVEPCACLCLWLTSIGCKKPKVGQNCSVIRVWKVAKEKGGAWKWWRKFIIEIMDARASTSSSIIVIIGSWHGCNYSRLSNE